MLKVDNLYLTPEKAILLGKTAIISDLHLGIENVLLDRGVSIPRLQIDEIVSNVKRIVWKYNVEKLVIAGDFKHEFSKNLPYEWQDIEKFLSEIDVEIVVVRGNHDNYLSVILSKFKVPLVDELIIKNWKIVHGHIDCESKRIIMGHEHPVVRVRVEGGIYTFPCYLKASNNKSVIVLPSFSPFLSGSNILEIDSFLSPILSSFNINDLEVFAIADEVFYLGKIGNLKYLMKN